MELRLSEEEKKTLCAIARRSIESCFRPAVPLEFSGPSYRVGAFVTLHQQGRLRGCIGRMASDLPVAETVSRMAKAAAFDDPRFDALTEEELDSISIEISLLGPMRKITDPEKLLVGRHGVYIHHQGRTGGPPAPGGGGVRLGPIYLSRPGLPQGGPSPRDMEGPEGRTLYIRGIDLRRDQEGEWLRILRTFLYQNSLKRSSVLNNPNNRGMAG